MFFSAGVWDRNGCGMCGMVWMVNRIYCVGGNDIYTHYVRRRCWDELEPQGVAVSVFCV